MNPINQMNYRAWLIYMRFAACFVFSKPINRDRCVLCEQKRDSHKQPIRNRTEYCFAIHQNKWYNRLTLAHWLQTSIWDRCANESIHTNWVRFKRMHFYDSETEMPWHINVKQISTLDIQTMHWMNYYFIKRYFYFIFFVSVFRMLS